MQTNSNLQHIHTKIDELQIGLLRVQECEVMLNLHVKVKCNGMDSIDCLLKDDMDASNLLNKKVSLVQKSEKNYLYISGEVTEISNTQTQKVSVRILRACWFVLQSSGAVSWLKEKYICDIPVESELELAS